MYHVRRDALPRECPAYITLRIRRDVPSLRRRALVSEMKRSFAVGERGDFRLVQFSIQRDHLHLLVEASDEQAISRGMKSICARVAHAVNRVFKRNGAVLLGRYHVRALRTPREVRNALAYVLLNVRKHWKQRTGSAPPLRLDQASSGAGSPAGLTESRRCPHAGHRRSPSHAAGFCASAGAATVSSISLKCPGSGHLDSTDLVIFTISPVIHDAVVTWIDFRESSGRAAR
ncbi:MAG TPA: transposase [Myxococcota bacterium]|nr:transposase [Myxococcota bacterium]